MLFRMDSSRLPGKMMAEINDHPILGHLINRLSLCQKLDGIVIATTKQCEDEVIDFYCRNKKIPCFRGSENEMLERLVAAREKHGASKGVIVSGDCPLIDPAIVDTMV